MKIGEMMTISSTLSPCRDRKQIMDKKISDFVCNYDIKYHMGIDNQEALIPS
jgi:hypothetical protein